MLQFIHEKIPYIRLLYPEIQQCRRYIAMAERRAHHMDGRMKRVDGMVAERFAQRMGRIVAGQADSAAPGFDEAGGGFPGYGATAILARKQRSVFVNNEVPCRGFMITSRMAVKPHLQRIPRPIVQCPQPKPAALLLLHGNDIARLQVRHFADREGQEIADPQIRMDAQLEQASVSWTVGQQSPDGLDVLPGAYGIGRDAAAFGWMIKILPWLHIFPPVIDVINLTTSTSNCQGDFA